MSTVEGPNTEAQNADSSGEVRLTGQHQAIKVIGRRSQLFTASSIALFVVAAAISFMVVGQLREPDSFRQQLETESEGDLARILSSLSSESSALQEELGSLKVDLANVINSSADQGATQNELDAQLRALQVLSGTTKVTGPGLELVIEDPQLQVTFDALVDAVQELRDAGAEALAINGRRIGVRSSFGQNGKRVTLDGVDLPTPYTLTAIGPGSTMEGGLNIPGGAVDTLRSLNGVHIDVHTANSLELPALEEVPTFKVARPVESSR